MAGSNEGNEGNEGNAGNAGRWGGGSFAVLPDRVDLPFIEEPDLQTLAVALAEWDEGHWAPDWGAWRILAEFAQVTAPLRYANTGPAGGSAVGANRPAVVRVDAAGNNTGGGNVRLDGTPLAAGATYGTYTLTCSAEAANGGTFELRPPGGGAPIQTVAMAAGEAAFTTQLRFTVKDDNPDFKLGDRFDLTVVPVCWIEPPATYQNGVTDDDELQTLFRYATDERADALGEIVAQHDSFLHYFAALLKITPGSHPKTLRLLHVASLIGAYASLHCKGVYRRPRPSQLRPGLMPPVPVPGHPAYPSGHATQATLAALCLRAALPPKYNGLARAALRLAARIARNREIAGVHYPSDSAAGQRLARDTMAFLNSGYMAAYVTAAGGTPLFGPLLTAAGDEWP
jgi:hypothetical protein